VELSRSSVQLRFSEGKIGNKEKRKRCGRKRYMIHEEKIGTALESLSQAGN
jgi:hypothetical protein